MTLGAIEEADLFFRSSPICGCRTPATGGWIRLLEAEADQNSSADLNMVLLNV
jgi:hypothetical protein